MWVADGWNEYEVIDTDNKEKLERWGSYTVVRPDPQVIWNKGRSNSLWGKADAYYIRSSGGGGHWENTGLPEEWMISYKDMNFKLKPLGFKHTGLFPEQAVNWDFIRNVIEGSGKQEVQVLNLFAYTGGATVAAAKAGAKVTHVDASKGMVAWAKENILINNLGSESVRYIVDDCMKFVKREQRREKKYDVIIMDPPSYGRGPNKELWKIEDCIFDLVKESVKLLSDEPLLFLINSYTTGLSPSVMKYILSINTGNFNVNIEADEIGLPIRDNRKLGLVLPCGASARAVFKKENDKL